MLNHTRAFKHRECEVHITNQDDGYCVNITSPFLVYRDDTKYSSYYEAAKVAKDRVDRIMVQELVFTQMSLRIAFNELKNKIRKQVKRGSSHLDESNKELLDFLSLLFQE